MKTIYQLDDEEVEKVKFKAEFITNRVDQRPGLIKPGLGGFEEPWGTGRIDMFWIRCYLDGTDLGPAVIEPNLAEPNVFSVYKNWCKAEPWNKIREE